MGWNTTQAFLITEPIIYDKIQADMNLIKEFEMFAIQELRDHVLTYFNLLSRQAQNANMMHCCILNTITEEVNSKKINKTEIFFNQQH